MDRFPAAGIAGCIADNLLSPSPLQRLHSFSSETPYRCLESKPIRIIPVPSQQLAKKWVFDSVMANEDVREGLKEKSFLILKTEQGRKGHLPLVSRTLCFYSVHFVFDSYFTAHRASDSLPLTLGLGAMAHLRVT
jgi:hypothetical protein